MPRTPLPAGYTRVEEAGATIVARQDVVDAVVEAVRAAPRSNPTLHGYASEVFGARLYAGRGVAYAIRLPGEARTIVIRHNRHGGALRALTGDLFLRPTRAPAELTISIELKALGIPSPPILAYAIYPAGPGMARSDVASEEIPDAADLGDLLLRTTAGSAERRRIWAATSRLLKRLSLAGVRHHDLNVKNVLIRAMSDGDFAAYILDVDRVEFECTRRDALAGNRARLRRSVMKWQRTRGVRIDAGEVSFLGSDYFDAASATTSS